MLSLKDIQNQMMRDLISRKKNVEYLNNAERLDVYGKGYFVRIKQTLESDYSYVQSLLGKPLFDEIIMEFIQTHPAKSYNLIHFGEDFPEFLRAKLPNMPWLADLATYELNKIHSYHCSRAAPIDIEKFKTIPIEQWNNAKFSFQKHLILMKTKWPIHLLLNFGDSKKSFSPDQVSAVDSYYMVYQHDDATYLRSIEDQEFKIIELLQFGESLGDVCSAIDDESALQSIFTWFQGWHSLELITDIQFESYESE